VCNFSILTFFKFWQEEQRVKERTLELAMVQEATIESMSSLTETRDRAQESISGAPRTIFGSSPSI